MLDEHKTPRSVGSTMLKDTKLPMPEETIDLDKTETKAKAKRRWLPAFWYRWSKRRKILVVLATLAIIIGAVAAVYTNYINVSHGASQPKKGIVAKPKTVASPLTGIQVAPELAKRPVTGIMIENSPDARPQSGIQDAGVVFEAIAEGGITRFMTLYQDAQPQYIGPVRSLRPYYLDMAAPFQASIAHVGGSPDALSEVRNGNYRDIDQFFNANYYQRVSSRAAPHNVYTSFASLDSLNQAKGYTSSKFSPWLRKKDSKLATPTAKTIDFSISAPLYYAHYDYNPANNTYSRSEGGAAHIATRNANDSGVQLAPKVVVAAVMSYTISDDGQHSVYGDTGSGTAYVFQDGGVTTGTWNKPDKSSMITFKDAKGEALKLDAGQTWVTLVRTTDEVKYTP